MLYIVWSSLSFTNATVQSALRWQRWGRARLKTLPVHEAARMENRWLRGGRGISSTTWLVTTWIRLTICQRAVVGLRIEIDLDHLTPPSWHKDPIQLFCVVTPPVCVDPTGYAPAVDNIEVRGIEVESALCVRPISSSSTRPRVLPLVQVVNLEI